MSNYTEVKPLTAARLFEGLAILAFALIPFRLRTKILETLILFRGYLAENLQLLDDNESLNEDQDQKRTVSMEHRSHEHISAYDRHGRPIGYMEYCWACHSSLEIADSSSLAETDPRIPGAWP